MRRRSGLIWINSYAGIWLGVGKVARKDDVDTGRTKFRATLHASTFAASEIPEHSNYQA
jgi:hypothetical protein